MKSRKYLMLIFALLVLVSCEKVDVEKDVPNCVVKSIQEFSTNVCDTGSNVKEYTFQNKTVYVFDGGNCRSDQSYKVLNADCNVLGTLGGISGNTKINGEDFSNAVYIRTVWTK